MTNRLGRGLGALIPTAPTTEVGGAHLAQVPIAAIRPNPRQPRIDFDEDALEELAASVRAVGLLQPVVVRQVPGTGPDGQYELVMGERRWRAAERAGLAEIPAVVRNTPDDALLRDALLENLHRRQLNPLEEAGAYAGLLEDFGATHEELAARVGKSRSHVTNTLRLLALPAPVQRRVAAGVLSAGHARALLALASPQDQERLASRIVAEGLSVRTVEEIVAVGAQPGAPVGPRPAARGRRGSDADLSEFASRLSDRLDTRVTVDLGRRKGKIVVEFATREDLERLVGVLAPDGADVERQSP